MSPYNDVTKFILACDQERTEANRHLYQKLIVEEFWEFMDGYKKADKIDVLGLMIAGVLLLIPSAFVFALVFGLAFIFTGVIQRGF